MENLKIYNENLYDDISSADLIISGDLCCNSSAYDSHSIIYRVTNEKVSDTNYICSMIDRKDVLAITGSGDQVLNAILVGGRKIDTVDISVFPKYYLALKAAAVLTLSEDEYLEFILGNNDENISPLGLKYYDKVRKELSEDSLLFWDSIYSKYGSKDLGKSRIFGNFLLNHSRMIKNNPYLQGSNYTLLRDLIKDTIINSKDGDFFEEAKKTRKKYDLILLTNLFNCFEKELPLKKRVQDYKRIIKELPLKREGVALTYNFTYEGFARDYFYGDGFETFNVDEQIPNAIEFNNELIVYKRKRLMPFLR